MTTFSISCEQEQRANEWIRSRKSKYSGAVGGRFSYVFTGTGIGEFVKVVDNMATGDEERELDLTDFSEW